MGTRVDEKLLHEYFSPYRIRGEWFSWGGELASYILALIEESKASGSDGYDLFVKIPQRLSP
jgi:hypothetical protein